jgi:serine/threonine protein kinase
MGIIYCARGRKLGRDVAVETLKPAGDDGDRRPLFERVARATAQFSHPNIVTLHHVGEHEGQPYLVLELLTGETRASRASVSSLRRRGRSGDDRRGAGGDCVRTRARRVAPRPLESLRCGVTSAVDGDAIGR